MEKNRKSSRYIVYSLLFVMLLTGCNTTEQPTQPVNQPTTTKPKPEPTPSQQPRTKQEQPSLAGFKEEALKVPETPEELFAYPAGKLSGKPYEENQEAIEKELDQFPPLSASNNEEYWNQLVYLFAEHHPHPSTVVWPDTKVGDPDIDGQFTLKENLNVEIVLDASGSMANKIGGTTMMEQAKLAIRQFAASLPKDANVALRVYGHKGTGSEKDKTLSCGSSELVYSFRPYNEKELSESLGKFKPAGWTPIARSLEGVKQDLAPYHNEKNTNIVYLVSDGVETCGGDPAKVAAELVESNISPIVNIIGFDVDSDGENQLKKIAESAKGTYVTVHNQDQLMKELNRNEEMIEKWEKWKEEAIDYTNKSSSNYLDAFSKYISDMMDLKNREKANIDEAIDYLEEAGKIPHDDSFTLKELNNNRTLFIENIRSDLAKTFRDMRSKKEEELKKAINDKFKQNTSVN
ncbi:VWA domain-containing protein [Brevibacillus migulae]|uniref:VWA domain-containing protein n=1 Tax=Brevibacillus migulae TaxID=1644114 RepID=UPI0014319D51|nr:VWA domain-containing protein [Brevibacillus migulae]